MKVNRLQDSVRLSLRVDEIGDGDLHRSGVLGDAWLGPLLTPQFEVGGDAVEVAFRARRVGDNVDVTGSFVTRLAFRCSRCGDDALLPLEGDFEVLYVPAGAQRYDLTGDGEGAELEGDFAIEEIRGGAIDVEPALAEALVLALPAYPMCSETCRGRCGGCGANLNEEACRCEEERTVDPRWAALSGLQLPTASGDGADDESRSRRQKRRK